MNVAVHIAGLNKTYRVWRHSRDMLIEALIGGQRHHEFKALQDIDLEVPCGSVLGIMGRNGAGKSTLLRIIAGTLDASSGTVRVNGRIAAILELGTGFHLEYSGRENVFLGGMCLGLTRAQIAGRFDEIVSFSELEEFIDQPFRTYSSGMQARLTFAVATCVDPDVLIIDEALGVGDARFQLKSFDRIRSFKQKGKSILLVSHNISSIVAICDRAILLEKGRIVADGDPNAVGNRYHEMLFAPKPDSRLALGPDAGAGDAGRADGQVARAARGAAVDAAGEPVHDTAEGAPGPEPGERADVLRQALTDLAPTTGRERRYGRRRIEIVATRIEDESGHSVRTVTSLGRYRLVCRIRAKEAMTDLCFGFLLRDVRGVDLFGWDMLNDNLVPLDPIVAGEEREIAVAFSANLAAGHYFFSVTLAHWDATKEDVRFDAQDLIVAPTPSVYAASLVNLDVEFLQKYAPPARSRIDAPLATSKSGSVRS
jgi:lipopolysaccharide transport system ATP-binding protein